MQRRHVDLNGNEFPFSRGVSFYEVDDSGKIVAARDLVEPAVKPGASALLVSRPQLSTMHTRIYTKLSCSPKPLHEIGRCSWHCCCSAHQKTRGT